MSSLFNPQAIHSGFFLRSAIFLNSHFLPSKVSNFPEREDYPLTIILIAYMAKIIPTIPGNIPTTPKLEHPPKLT